MTDRVYNVLILCTCNTARSLMMEALFNVIGKGRFRAFSAGRTPNHAVHPLAAALAAKIGYAPEKLCSKGWDEFAGPDAPVMDFIITVSDDLAGEPTPAWPGHPVSAHWHFADPAQVRGSDAERLDAFEKTLHEMMTRVNLFTHLPLAMLDRQALHHELARIGTAA